MDAESRRAALKRLVEALKRGQTRPVDDVYDDDVVIEWPRSGEVVRGKQNIAEVRAAYPTLPTATLRRIIGSADLWVAEVIFAYHGARYYPVPIHEYRGIHEYRDGREVGESWYFEAPVEAPAWRAHWDERAASSPVT
jgi:SnoaL-like domain